MTDEKDEVLLRNLVTKYGFKELFYDLGTLVWDCVDVTHNEKFSRLGEELEHLEVEFGGLKVPKNLEKKLVAYNKKQAEDFKKRGI